MIDRLRRDVKACEGIVKMFKDKDSQNSKRIQELKAEKTQHIKLTTKITEGFDRIEAKIKDTFQREIRENAKEVEVKVCEESKKTFAEMVKFNEDKQRLPELRQIIYEERIKQLTDENDKKLRSRNIIVHGVLESPITNPEIQQEADNIFANSLMKDLELNTVPKSIKRIGQKLRGKNRPIKIILESEF